MAVFHELASHASSPAIVPKGELPRKLCRLVPATSPATGEAHRRVSTGTLATSPLLPRCSDDSWITSFGCNPATAQQPERWSQLMAVDKNLTVHLTPQVLSYVSGSKEAKMVTPRPHDFCMHMTGHTIGERQGVAAGRGGAAEEGREGQRERQRLRHYAPVPHAPHPCATVQVVLSFTLVELGGKQLEALCRAAGCACARRHGHPDSLGRHPGSPVPHWFLPMPAGPPLPICCYQLTGPARAVIGRGGSTIDR